MRLGAGEFIRRFLLHVLPRGFTRLRHYGVLANATRRQNACNVLIFRSRKPKVGTTRHRAGERGRGAQTQIRGGGWAGKFSLSC